MKKNTERSFIDNLVRCAKKEFFDECGEFDSYHLQVEKDYYRTCMAVVSNIVSELCSSDGYDYFHSIYDFEFKHYFGG